MDPGKVHRLVAIALTCRAIAEERDRNRVPTLHLVGKRNANSLRQLRTDDVGKRKQIHPRMRPVQRELPRCAKDLTIPRQELHQHFRGGCSQREHRGQLTVVDQVAVSRRIGSQDRPQLRRLMPLRRRRDRRLPLPIQRPYTNIQRPAQAHRLIRT